MSSLREESRAGRTIVLTTQVLTEAEELCDDILILNHGRQVARGDLHTLKLLSEGVYDVTLTFDELPSALAAEVAAERPLRMEITGTTLQVSLKEDEQRVLAFVSRLAARGGVRRVEVGGASLEDVFVELTSGAKEVR
jgi:ABC-2 type transport system ATP-binding protein